MPDQRAGMAHRQQPGLEIGDHAVGQGRQTLEIGDMAARFFDQPCDLGLGQLFDLGQAIIGPRFLDRIEILALDILDQRQRHHIAV